MIKTKNIFSEIKRLLFWRKQLFNARGGLEKFNPYRIKITIIENNRLEDIKNFLGTDISTLEKI